MKELVILVLVVFAGIFFMHDKEKTQEVASLKDDVEQLQREITAKDTTIANNAAEIAALRTKFAQASASSYDNRFHNQFQPQGAAASQSPSGGLKTDSLKTGGLRTQGVQGSNDGSGSALNEKAYR